MGQFISVARPPAGRPGLRCSRLSRGATALRRAVLAAALISGGACDKPAGPAVTVTALPVPAARAPQLPQLLRLADGSLAASWLESRPGGGYSFMLSIWSTSAPSWEPARTIASDPALAMFGADLPGLDELPGGVLAAYWETHLERPDPFATALHLALSRDRGATWPAVSAPPAPQRAEAAQHSFVSTFPVGGALGLVWLDGSAQTYQPPSALAPQGRWLGATGVRFATLTADGRLSGEQTIDATACECCPTAAALTTRGPLVAYRGRAEPPGAAPAMPASDRPAVRDVQVARLRGQRWLAPQPVHADGWIVNGCPDNGPAVAASGDQVAVAWWTAASGGPRVNVSFSIDDGDHFASPVRADQGHGEGQVTVALTAGGGLVGWLEDGRTWARWVGTGGLLGPPVDLGPAPPHTRLPRWIGSADGAVAAWIERGAASGNVLRMARLETDLSAVDVAALGCCVRPGGSRAELASDGIVPAPARAAADPQHGRVLFASYGCALCHGEQGAGDGRLARTLARPPRDLRDRASFRQGTALSDISSSIARGVPGMGMPAHGFIPEADRNLLAAFILSLDPNSHTATKGGKS